MSLEQLRTELETLMREGQPATIHWVSIPAGAFPVLQTSSPLSNKHQLIGTDVTPTFKAFILEGGKLLIFIIVEFTAVNRRFVLHLSAPIEEMNAFFQAVLKYEFMSLNDVPNALSAIEIAIVNPAPLISMLSQVNA